MNSILRIRSLRFGVCAVLQLPLCGLPCRMNRKHDRDGRQLPTLMNATLSDRAPLRESTRGTVNFEPFGVTPVVSVNIREHSRLPRPATPIGLRSASGTYPMLP